MTFSWYPSIGADGHLLKSAVLDGKTFEEKYRADWEHIREDFGSEWFSLHRVDLHHGLKEAALHPPEGVEKPVLRLGHPVTSVDCESGIITLKDGTTHKKDVIVGADGVHVSWLTFPADVLD